jgi:DNA-binding transcriptional LysR family regulator
MSNPQLRLPSLDLIRGFVAVGRRMSVTLAAKDLYLTQSAVSRQIHTLEEALGTRLFVRRHRAIAFTADGERLFRVSDAGLMRMQEVLEEIGGVSARRPVTISASVGFCGLWLLPRLGLLQQQSPGLDVRISAKNRLENIRQEGIDLAIRYSRKVDAPDDARRLFGETVLPVAHPSLGIGRISSADDLSGRVLLDYDDVVQPLLHWSGWLAAMGWGRGKPKAILRFNQYDQMIQAAVAGQGIALGRLELLRSMFADRRLVPLVTQKSAVKSEHAYWLLQAEAKPRADVQKVADWISAEARRGAAAA